MCSSRAMAKVLRGLGVEDWLLEDLEVTPQYGCGASWLTRQCSPRRTTASC